MTDDIATGPGWELRCGRWQDILTDRDSVDSVIGDPPYSHATHKGQRGCRTSEYLGSIKHSGIEYEHITDDDIAEAAKRFATMARRWIVFFGDHVTAEAFRIRFDTIGWYAFPPVPWIKTDAAPRIMSDGPSPQHETISIARPRRLLERHEKRFRPGWYKGRSAKRGENFPSFVGRKPVYLMRALIRDYSEPGDLILDPYAGTGTTILAALIEGRRAIGAEMNPETFDLAVKRLKKGYTPTFL